MKVQPSVRYALLASWYAVKYPAIGVFYIVKGGYLAVKHLTWYFAPPPSHPMSVSMPTIHVAPEASPEIPQSAMREHTHILGPSGSGKTSLLQSIITKQDAPMVIIDPKGLMIKRLARLEAFKDRVIIIDPRDGPALGLFKGEATSRVIEMFGYLFSTAQAPLTQRQSIPFSFVVKLVFDMGGDLDTLMDVLEDTPKNQRFNTEIAALSLKDKAAKRFFATEFYTSFSDTKQQIRTRLYEIISKPELAKMFNAPECRIDFTDILTNNKVLLVNTGMTEIGPSSSALLGRYVIAMTLNAAYKRKTKQLAHLIVDEAQEFVDEAKTPEILRLAREYGLGVTLAHQNMFCAEFNDAIRSAISTNTSIKYCSGPKGRDLAYMARDFDCEPSVLSAHHKSPTEAKFACVVRGHIDRPFTVAVPFGDIGPKMEQDDYKALLKANRERVRAKKVEVIQSDTPSKRVKF